ncbi:FMN-binding protein [Mahella sp.]|uniref:FMN-binding protein n=1 Tax=Mahella sp. TaxID=2798721 RepID=UPI0025B87E31|nr:FMN-binding protein [Mahella sp.]MBZ4665573.1 FMN-binding domain protein [Mahella sp.]
MKRILALALVAVMALFVLAACSSNEGTPQPTGDTSSETVTYKDGTYKGQSSKNDHGQYGDIEITIKDGKISDVKYKEVMEDGSEKTLENDGNYQEAIDAIEALPQKLIDVQDPDKIDTISKATGTTDMFKEAAKNALEQAK